MSKIRVISREEVPSLYSVIVNEQLHHLGVLKDFKKHDVIKNFIPENCTLSMAWVHLGQNEILKTHVHSVSSLILICNGEVRLVGDHNQLLHEGDALLIPPTCYHGLIGAGENGFWGLSIQFEMRGLYENPDEPLTKFLGDDEKIIDTSCCNLSRLFQVNAEYLNDFSENPLFKLFISPNKFSQSLNFSFLKYFQVWSDNFQKIVLARELFCDHPEYKDMTRDHLNDEWGHNNSLKKDHKLSKNRWDPILEATASWFIWKMGVFNENEKIVLVHLVIEASATVFYEKIPKEVWASIQSNHGELHRHLDVEHDKVGLNMLEGLKPAEYLRLNQVQQEGWQMLNQCFQRMHELILADMDQQS